METVNTDIIFTPAQVDQLHEELDKIVARDFVTTKWRSSLWFNLGNNKGPFALKDRKKVTYELRELFQEGFVNFLSRQSADDVGLMANRLNKVLVDSYAVFWYRAPADYKCEILIDGIPVTPNTQYQNNFNNYVEINKMFEWIGNRLQSIKS